ncbi:MAG: hypothetical protein ABJJ07_16005, partial [Maribacter dokdonensis]
MKKTYLILTGLPMLFLVTLLLTSCSDEDSTTSDTTYETTDDDIAEDGDSFILDCSTSDAEQSANTEIETMRQAVVDFRNSLSTSLLEEVSVCLDDERFYLWHNTPAN